MPHRTTDSTRVRADARDRGLRRVRTVTGWITVASATGAVVLAGGYAQALPGKTASSSKPVTPGTTIQRTTTAPSTAAAPSAAPTSAPAPALQAPTQAPTTAVTTAHATSGGS